MTNQRKLGVMSLVLLVLTVFAFFVTINTGSDVWLGIMFLLGVLLGGIGTTYLMERLL